jgi:MFS family permease
VAGFGIATLVIALLPGYAAWGEASIVALVFLRLVDGIFIGGEYTAANPLAMEYCPKDKRGHLCQIQFAVTYAGRKRSDCLDLE